ncbi:type II CRISPR RNA-guided endonuclease Cas9 [Halalkalibacillus halophilus]|uniref:type II CRISPR RNA-guided endonuclease Cas9 n=1 Tax=Halalkalibacillus halophilus TaxID=392827 RepID=UPI00041AE0CB|nr:type II CRISPR RNA-guided endonuclease Cas9 [Halalkalibacillus halophilus]
MKQFENNYTLGLDIGIGSVGWGLVDEDQNIIDSGVRLFPEADVNNNTGRRGFRGARRLLRRRRHRLERIKMLLSNANLPTNQDKANAEETPYHIRVKGLTEKLSEEELSQALLHLGKRRGIHNVEVAEDETGGNELSTKDQLNQNAKALKNQYVCEVQLNRLENEGEVRGHRNRFKTSDYVAEARQLLSIQQKYHSKVTDEFIDQYLELIEKRREYYEGPGFGSEYGWEQDRQKWYEQMMGRCSYYPEELRSVKEAYSAQLFNVLNDLNNLVLTRDEDHKLSTEEKEELVEKVFKKYKSPKLNKIAKVLELKEDDIKGYRVTSKGTAEFTPLKIYHDLLGITDKKEVLEDEDALDEIAEILTIYQTPSDIKEELEKLDLPLNKVDIESISELSSYSQTHSLSLKLIHQVIPDLWATPKNQMQLFTENGIKPKKIKLEGKKYIPFHHLDEWILSPVVKRSFKQSIRIVNEIRKQYGEPKEIVIELARENSSDDKKNFLKELNKKNRAVNEAVMEKLESKDLEPKKGMFNKLRLWHIQDGLCMYSLKPIQIEDLLSNPTNYEIDHILPRSVSFDDSQKNKVLVHTEENQKKGNETPYQYLSSGKGHVSYEKYKSHVLQLAKSRDKMPKKKVEYLLEERDINKYDIQKEFINRNLVDTRYATRGLLTLLTTFFSENNKDVKVKAINGAFTDFLRKTWDFKKDRGADFKHHAEDALIVAMAGYLFQHQRELKKHNILLTEGKNGEEKTIDKETGEILEEKTFVNSFTERMDKVKAIKNYPNYKYSHKVDMKPNRQLMNDTLYSTRKVDDKEFVIEKIKDLYDKDQDKLVKQIKKDPTKLLMYHHDPQTYKKIERAIEQYSDAKNPLHKMYEETGEYLRKYSKKGNGPIIKSVKYYGNSLKEHKDVSHKFNTKDKKVVNLSLKPFRMDVYEDDGVYKFVTVSYKDLIEEKENYRINNDVYLQKLINKKIANKDGFVFSLYKNDVCKINGEYFRLIGVNHDEGNRIEMNKINYHYKDYAERNEIKQNRIYKGISKNTNEFIKIHTDVLGNVYFNSVEKFKSMYQK